MDRRTVLKGLGALGLAAAWPGRAVSAERRTAVVVGSGIAGLSAAYDLQRAGFAVTVFERKHRAGGRMAEDWYGPLWLPTGAEAVHEANREMYALASEVGLTDELAGAHEYPMYPLDNGHAEYFGHLRWHTTEIMNVPGLSADAKRRLPAILFDLARIRAEVDPCLLATGASWDRENVWEYFARKLGENAAREVVDYWVQPALDPWAWRAEETSMIAWLAVVAQQNARFVIPRGGIGVLTRKLATLVDLELATTVRTIAAADASGRRVVHYLTPRGEARSVAPDVVVCATEGNFVPAIVEDLAETQARFFERIHMVKWISPIYILRKEHAPSAPQRGGVYTDNHTDPRKKRILGWSAVPGDPGDPRNPPRVHVNLAPAERPKWIASGKDMASYCLPLVRELYPALSEDKVADVVLYGMDDMLVYLPTGFVRDMAAFLEQQERTKRGLYFAGEYLSHAHTGGACASGRTVARTIARHWFG